MHCGVFQHKTRPTVFCLCVDDFGIKYHTTASTRHLLNVIRKNYQYTTDWKGSICCGLTLKWNHSEGYIDISMPGYLGKSLVRLQYKKKVSPQYSPHAHIPI